MKRKIRRVLVAAGALIVLIAGAPVAFTQWSMDLETGMVWSGYNDVRIPGTSGTKFSLSSDLDAASGLFFRARLGWQFRPRHFLSLFVAPLTFKATGRIGRDVIFKEEVFPAGIPLKARYTFNSYRATYRYTLVDTGKWAVGVGFTAKIRDAIIRLDGGGKVAEKANVGFVPLLHLKVERRFGEKLGLLLEGDALAAPQGRAEDVFLGAWVKLGRSLSLRAGYRFVEGGADTDEVYTFAWIHYGSAGLTLSF